VRLLGQLLATLFIAIALGSTLFLQNAAAWMNDAGHDTQLKCKGIPLNGADIVVVRASQAGFAVPALVGLKNGKLLWETSFPNADTVSPAKSQATCRRKKGGKGVVIGIWSQLPGPEPWVIQYYRWDGRSAKRLGRWVTPWLGGN
jgi:hypothetical protein